MVQDGRKTSQAPAVRPQRKSMAGEVAEELRHRILAGRIPEGTQLMQEQLAAEFGIRKVPVREALFQLEAEGFVTQQFHKGAVVSSLSPKQIMQIFELRTEIEVWLLGIAMPLASNADVAAAKEYADQFKEMEEPMAAWDFNWRFHEALYIPADKPFVIDHLKKLHSQTARHVRLQYSLALDKTKIVNEHETILALYAAKNANAQNYLRDHILKAARRLTERLSSL